MNLSAISWVTIKAKVVESHKVSIDSNKAENIYYKFSEMNIGGKMNTVSLEQVKAQEILEILSNIVQKSIVKNKNKGDEDNE